MPGGTEAGVRLRGPASAAVSEAVLLRGRGDVFLGDRCIVHPLAELDLGDGGRIELGPECVVCERARLVVERDPARPEEPPTLRLGARVLVDVGSHVRARAVGDDSVLEARSVVKSGVSVGRGCRVGPTAVVKTDLADETQLVCLKKPRGVEESRETGGGEQEEEEEVCRQRPGLQDDNVREGEGKEREGRRGGAKVKGRGEREGKTGDEEKGRGRKDGKEDWRRRRRRG